MIDEKPDHIDQLYKDQYEQVEVRYNAAHWTQLQGALVAATAAGIASSVPTSTWSRIAKFFKANKILTIISTIAIPLVIAVVLLSKPAVETKLEKSVPPSNIHPKETPAVVIAEDTFLYHGTDSMKLYRHGKLIVPDTLINPVVLSVDSLDSLKVDTVKKDIFIFW
jgi:hypothetical protein